MQQNLQIIGTRAIQYYEELIVVGYIHWRIVKQLFEMRATCCKN